MIPALQTEAPVLGQRQLLCHLSYYILREKSYYFSMTLLEIAFGMSQDSIHDRGGLLP